MKQVGQKWGQWLRNFVAFSLDWCPRGKGSSHSRIPAQGTLQLHRGNPEQEMIPLLPEGRCQCPGPGLTFRARETPGLWKETCRQKARIREKKKTTQNQQLATTVRDLYFQLHFPALMSSYFQGIQIIQSRCYFGYHFKDFFFSQEIKKSFNCCFISANDFAFSFLTSN